MDTLRFASCIVDAMGVEPTRQQLTLAAALARYCSPLTPSDSVFILNGYAGTGKTTVIGALVKALQCVGLKAVLLAPTGRAAKVLAAHAAHPASTIHRRIYRHAAPGSPGSAAGLYRIGIAENRSSDTVFIVDEASMIADDPEGSLLADLIHYVFTGTRCRLILSGDTAQLPPPGSDFSPAMESETFRRMGLHVMRATMTATVRQAATSGILYNATLLRRNMTATPIPLPRLRQRPFADVRAITSEDLLDALSAAYSENGTIGTLLITRSNTRAVKFNLAIRSQILDFETELSPGEPLMIARNNYYWTRGVKGVDFIANGDTAIVERVYGTEIRGDVIFADVALRFPDHDITLDTKILLSTLYCEAPALTPKVADDLLHAVTDYPPGSADPGPVPVVDLRNDPYYNALQVKYAYAVTCHKAQGGQWTSVFVDMAALQLDALTSLDFYRWLYTATTRAVGSLTYIAPPEQIID